MSIAHMARAILLANAIATTMRGFLVQIRASHDPSPIPLLPAQFRRDIAPMISALRDRPTERIWTVTSAFIGLATGAGIEDEMRGIRDFLDSSMGRHFADDVIEALQGRAINNEIAIIKAIEKWQAWTISNETQRIEGIPAGLPYLAGWVQHFAILAASDTAN